MSVRVTWLFKAKVSALLSRLSPKKRWMMCDMTNLGSDGEGGLGILARAEGRRGEWGRKVGRGEGRGAREEGGRAPPRRGWRLSENGDGRLLNTSLLTNCGKTVQIHVNIHEH